MSNDFETILTLLLKLNAGLLDEPRASEIKGRIESDPRWQRRWQRLRENWFDSEHSIGTPEPAGVDPFLIAGFVDGTLPQEVARRLEASAWQSPPLLREIAVTFQFANQPIAETIDDQVDAARIDRLLMGSLVNEHLNGWNVPPAMSPATDRPIVFASDWSSTPSRNARKAGENRSSANPSPSVKNRKSIWWWMSLATGFLVLCGSLIWLSISVYRNWQRDWQIAEPVRATIDDQPLAVDSVDADVQSPPNRSTEERIQNTPRMAERPVPTTPLPTERSLVDDGKLFDEMLSDEIRPPHHSPQLTTDLPDEKLASPDSDRPLRQVYVPLRPNWTRYEGAIGVWDPAKEVTHGYGSVSQLTDNMVIRVLPGSWASGELPSVGQIVLDADTSVRIGQRRNTEAESEIQRVEVQLEQGRMALKNLHVETRMLVTTGAAEWPVSIKQDKSDIAVHHVGGSATLFVRHGMVEIRGRSLSSGQQLNWQSGRWGDAQKARQDSRWMDRPDDYARIPDRFRKQLFDSPDVIDALAKLGNSSDKSMRVAALEWNFALRPASVAGIFSSRDTSRWVAVFEWLIRQPHGHARTRMAWRSLVDVSGNSEAARDLFRWSGLVTHDQVPPPAEVDKMLGYLNHNALFVRFAAAYYLEYYFQNPFGFQPAAAPQIRAQIIRRWRASIVEAYHDHAQRLRR